jgi:hypothetical protein
MSREAHVRFCERAVVRFRRATRLVVLGDRLAGCCKLDRKRNSVQFSQISATIAASASVSSNSFIVAAGRSTNNRRGS